MKIVTLLMILGITACYLGSAVATFIIMSHIILKEETEEEYYKVDPNWGFSSYALAIFSGIVWPAAMIFILGHYGNIVLRRIVSKLTEGKRPPDERE